MMLTEEKRPVLLVVDDSPDNLAFLSSLLRGSYRVKVATSGERALDIIAEDEKPDLVLLDIMMPGLDGYEVCRRLKRDPASSEIPVIFLTAKTDTDDEETGLSLGAVDYITKPASPPIVLARIKTHLNLKASADFLKDKNAFLEHEVVRRTREVLMIQDVTMVALGSLAETRDNETGNHIRRTQNYIRIRADRLKDNPRFGSYLSESTIELLYKSAPLHDIGKVGIPDNILKKPGSLEPSEFDVMKTHTVIGRDAIIAAEKRLSSPTSFLSIARDLAWSHHEKWDGSGYPRGLSGDAIPLPGRFMAIPDVYDALISRRVYKEPMSHEEAVGIIAKGAKTMFDPDIAAAFLEVAPGFREIAETFRDTEGNPR
jgi:putative two-component system response regulator